MQHSKYLISRRGFHWNITTAACAGFTLGSMSKHGYAEPAASFPAGKYVDIHVHLGQPWSKLGPLTPEMMLRWMDAHAISQAVVLPLISPESWFYPITPQWVLEQTKPFRDRLIPFCAIDPRSVHVKGVKLKVDLLNRYIDAGAKGFGEHKWGGQIDDPRNIELFQACGETKLPVLFHMDNLRNTDKPGLPGLEKALQAAPNTIMIGHAQGWWASISGDVTQAAMNGYPRGPVAPGGAIDRLMGKYPNLYGDLSAGSGANAIGRDPQFGREFLIRRAGQLLFGTDYLRGSQEVPQFDLLTGFKLPEDVQAKIFRDNARRILKLAGT